MRALTAAEMREADRRCIEEVGIPGAVLMNNAGMALFEEIEGSPIGVVCGKGNNGGDGFVLARLAHVAGFQPHVILLGETSELKGDAATFCRAYLNLGGSLTCATDEAAVTEAVAGLSECAHAVDAMLGTGTEGEVRGLYRTAVEAWPGVPTLAVDIPTGVHTDTGEVLGAAIRADVTVTFQFPKKGFENPAAQNCAGRLVVADIGIPPVCADDEAWAALKARVTSTP